MDSLRKFLNENENAKMYLVLVFAVGVILFTSSTLFDDTDVLETYSISDKATSITNSEVISQSANEYTSYERELTEELENILSMVEGAGDVKCMITFANTTETVFATDYEEDISSVVERDSDNGERTTTNENKDEKLVFVGDDSPLVVKEVLPQVEGVIIVAKGGDNAYIKKQFTNVATTLLDVDAHKVQILKMN